MKLDILAIGVHPDDIELSCSGTLLSHIAQGKTVGLLDLTMGELGTRGSGELRYDESMKAAMVMGAKIRENLRMRDGFFEHNEKNILKIVQIIRKYQPEIVFANAISDRHPDHGRAAKLTADACYLSGLLKVKTYMDGELQEKWRPKAIYHYIQDHNLKEDFVVDISEFIDQKMDCIMAYGSQFFDPDSKEEKTPISGQDFLDFIKAKNRTYGRPAGFEYAESFTVNRTIGVKNVFDLN
jgi:bacillithiol biosynthesis deacetylase BshB1